MLDLFNVWKLGLFRVKAWQHIPTWYYYAGINPKQDSQKRSHIPQEVNPYFNYITTFLVTVNFNN
jgi:hypothetical protein